MFDQYTITAICKPVNENKRCHEDTYILEVNGVKKEISRSKMFDLLLSFVSDKEGLLNV